MSEQPRVPAGSPIGGRWVTLYHGTTKASAEKIRKEGLRGSLSGKIWGPGSEYQATPGHVYVTPNPVLAAQFGGMASPTSGNYAVIEIRIPNKQLSKLKPDKNPDMDESFMWKGDIPKEWVFIK